MKEACSSADDLHKGYGWTLEVCLGEAWFRWEETGMAAYTVFKIAIFARNRASHNSQIIALKIATRRIQGAKNLCRLLTFMNM